MKNTKEKQLSIGYFSGMDVLRFICATGVIFHHTTLSLKEKGIATQAESIHRFSGAFFLDVFFIISGFLISLILMKEYEAGNFSIKNFFMRRILRIWPLFFLAVLIKIFILPLLNGVPWDIIRTNLIYACTFTINFQLLLSHAKTYTILWSICIEEHIYLLLPILVLVFQKKFRNLSWFFIVAGLISWVYFFRVPSRTGFSTAYFMSTSYFYYFGIGMLIACIHNGTIAGKNLENTLFKPLVQLVVMLLFFGFVFNGWGNHNSLIATLLFHGAFGGYLVWASTKENFILNMRPKFSRYFGNISYAMYISHVIIISLVIGISRKKGVHVNEALFGWGFPIIATLLTMALSSLLYYLYERPILKLKKRFTTVVNKEM
jgi:peptidoglycan/LPS O-acetylase OafA/YrhL